MVFGEIVEPSTRALFDDDYTEYPDNATDHHLEAHLEVPEVINTLVIIESTPIVNFFHKSIIGSIDPVSKLDNIRLEVYRLNGEKYVIVSKLLENIYSGQVVEILAPWIQKANCTYTVTSNAIVLHQNASVLKDSTECFIRSLTFKTSENFDYKKLEIPNLVTGLSADVLSYCIHNELSCCLFVAYMDLSYLDSLSTRPLLNLARNLKLPILESCKLQMTAPDNNLYT